MDLELKNPFKDGKIISVNTDPKVYHANKERGAKDFVMSRSDLMEFNRCPVRWRKGFAHKKTEDMEWGELLDATTLQPDSFSKLYAVTPELYPAEPKKKGDPVEEKPWNWNANYCKAWKQNVLAQGRFPVHYETMTEVLTARAALLDNPMIAELLNQSDRQVMCMATYHDEATGLDIAVKILIDICPHLDSQKYHACLADLKSGGSADPAKWEYHVDDFNLHAQAALYLDVYNAATDEERTSFLHPCQENYPPYHSELHLLDQTYIELGRMKYQQALKNYAKCLYTNEWPGYPGTKLAGFTLIVPPPRTMNRVVKDMSFPAPAPTPAPDPEYVDLIP